MILSAVLGFFNTPLGKYVAIAALVLSALFAAAVHQRGIGYEKGLAVGEKMLAEQAKANAAAVIALNRKYRAIEEANKREIDAIGASHAEKIKALQAQRDRDVRAARDGSIVLSIPSTCGGSSSSETGTSSAGSHAEARTELPRETTANLLSLANDADEVVNQLTACQAILTADRKAL